MNKAVLLQLQQDKAKAKQVLEMGYNMKQAYDNMSYEGNEIKQDPDSMPPEHESRRSKMTENQLEEKEERIDRF